MNWMMKEFKAFSKLSQNPYSRAGLQILCICDFFPLLYRMLDGEPQRQFLSRNNDETNIASTFLPPSSRASVRGQHINSKSCSQLWVRYSICMLLSSGHALFSWHCHNNLHDNTSFASTILSKFVKNSFRLRMINSVSHFRFGNHFDKS